MSLDRIAKVAFRRAGWASMLPDLADSVIQLGGYEPFFTDQARFSGLGNSVFDPGNFAVGGYADGVARAVQAGFGAAERGEIAEEDIAAFSRVLPLQNQPFLRSAFQRLGAQFDTRDEIERGVLP